MKDDIEKTPLRAKLERIEDAILKSWIKDSDKTEEIEELTNLISCMLEYESLEEFFSNVSDLDYFLKKFSKETLYNILRQNFVHGTNGDDIALNLLCAYVKLWLKFHDKAHYAPLWESIREIFVPSKSFYKLPQYGRIINKKKMINADSFNETLPINTEKLCTLQNDDPCDLLIENKASRSSIDRRAWVRGKVSSMDSEHYFVTVAEDGIMFQSKQNSFEILPVGTMTKDYDWRTSLKQWDVIDSYDRGRWYPSTILYAKHEIINGLPKSTYKVGFRLYIDKFPDYKAYTKYWQDKNIYTDSAGRKYIGDSEGMDETFPHYTRRIQKLNSVITGSLTIGDDYDEFFMDDFIHFDYMGKKNYIIGRGRDFSYYYALLLNNFANVGGYEKIVSFLSNKPYPDLVYTIFLILCSSFSYLHKQYIMIISDEITQKATNYIQTISSNELRHLKKETIELIVKVLNLYTLNEDKNGFIEEFSINTSVRLLKTSIFDKRLLAIKTLVDAVRMNKENKDKKEMLMRLIEENNIVFEIFGPNTHIQLVTHGKELIEILLKEDRLNDTQLELIWSGTQKGDLEGKLTILKMLKELKSELNSKQINILLQKIYSSKVEDLIDQEIDLIYELSIASRSEDSLENESEGNNIGKCIKFFTECLLNSSDINKINSLLDKIFEITKAHQSYRVTVINMCIECLEKNTSSILALKILSMFVKDDDKLQQDVSLYGLFCNNFQRHQDYARSIIGNTTNDMMIDNFPHSKHIKARLDYLILVQSQKPFVEVLNFVYETLVLNSVIPNDKEEFFSYIKKILFMSFDNRTELYDLFRNRICLDIKSCQDLTLNGFECYLQVFLDLNEKKNNLTYSYNSAAREKNLHIAAYVDPDTLIGFDLLWKIVFESLSNEIMNKGIETINMIYNSIPSFSQVLLHKCMSMIKEILKEENSLLKESKIKKCLLFLKLIIEESEKKGTALLRSHLGILKQKVINLNINALISRVKDFKLKVYGNTTLFELKEIISNKISIRLDFLRVVIKSREITDMENGKTLIEFNVENEEEIKIMMNNVNSYIPQADLYKNGMINPLLEKIFIAWFEEFSSDDKMTREDLAKFIASVTNSRDQLIATDDPRVIGIFADYDYENKGWITLKDFVTFFSERARDKRKIVWDNLYAMGYRNDLKKFNEPFETTRLDKNLMPRYQLANNDEYFDVIFSLLDCDGSVPTEAFDFLCFITTNPRIYMKILSNDKDWNDKNIYKLVYSLQIIESLIEEIDLDTSCIDLPDETNTLHSNEKKREWITQFVNEGGFSGLVSILNLELENNSANSMSQINKFCLELLIKIIRILFNSSLNRFEFYRKVEASIKKKKPEIGHIKHEPNHDVNSYTLLNKEVDAPVTDVNTISLQDDVHKDITFEDGFEFNTHPLQSLFMGNLGEKILKSLDYTTLATNLINVLNGFKLDKIHQEDLNIIKNSFEFLLGLISFSPESSSITKLIQSNEHFKQIFKFGIINKLPTIRESFFNSLIKFVKICEHTNKLDCILYLFIESFGIFYENQNVISVEFFELFSSLFELFYKNSLFKVENFAKSGIDCDKFISSLAKNIYHDLGDEDETTKDSKQKIFKLSNEMFIGHIKLLTKAVEYDSQIKTDVNSKYNLIGLILSRILLKQNSKEINEKLSKLELVNPEHFDDKSDKSSNPVLRSVCYDFILSMLTNSLENFESFFAMNLLEQSENEETLTKKKSDLEDNGYNRAIRHYVNFYGMKKEGHVGLRNLGATCYMNSILQQLFMVPTFRYAILQASDSLPLGAADDNVLHQLQRMFTFLDLSSREDYNASRFCFAFKDFDGNPTNTIVQQDSQEFLNRILEKIESGTKNCPMKYILQSVFGGKTCSQVICQGCGNVSNRLEEFTNLSLEVANMKTLYDSLDKLISPEKIDEFFCEKCEKKVTISKRNSLAVLPNVLIIHLQRIYYNYEIERNEKINSRLEFPLDLSLKKYCIEEMMNNNKENYETDEVYFKKDDFYEYKLTGVNVHWGSADSGHYFSYINTQRSGEENKLLLDTETLPNTWLTFNDSSISKFNLSKLEQECFGGSSSGDFGEYKMENNQSAYMLVYERVPKTPLKIVVPEPNDNLNVISFKAEDSNRIYKQYDISRIDYKPEENIWGTTFYDSNKNEYFVLKPFFSLERLIPRSYYVEVTEDNSAFQKQQNITDEQFVKFFENTIAALDQTICNAGDIKPETSEKICKALLNFVFKIINSKDKEKLLPSAIDRLSNLLTINAQCIDLIFDYVLNNPLVCIHNTLVNEDTFIVQNYSRFFIELIRRSWRLDGLYLNEDDIHSNGIRYKTRLLLDTIYAMFPKINSKYVNKIYPVYEIFKELLNLSQDFLLYLVNNKAICVFITYLLGRESPCYNLYVGMDSWDSLRTYTTHTENLIDVIYNIYKSSTPSDEDMICLKSSAFLKLIHKSHNSFFIELMTEFSMNDKEFSVKACEEITKNLEDISIYDESEIIKMINLILPILNIDDDYKLLRYEIIIGYPCYIFDDPNIKSRFPLFGYHRLSHEKSKWICYKTWYQNKSNSSILGKMFDVRIKERLSFEIFLILLENSISNKNILKYLRNIPGEEYRHKDIIAWGMSAIKEFSDRTNNKEYEEKLDKLLPIINSIDTKNFLPQLKGYIGDYLPKDIKREEITLICKGEGLYLIKFEYFTSIIPNRSDPIQFEGSASNYSTTFAFDGDAQEDEEHNISGLVLDQSKRSNSEREFIKGILGLLDVHKKINIYNKTNMKNVRSTLIRYVIFNTCHLEGFITMKINRPAGKEVDINEYIPGCVCNTVGAYNFKNMVVFNKTDPEMNWTTGINNLQINVNVDWSYSRTHGLSDHRCNILFNPLVV